jgi:tetratricopeptide (TPR) repeat protein
MSKNKNTQKNMSNIIASKPSFVFGYWRPWNENSNVLDSYLDYSRDTSLVKYGAETVGNFINQASKEQVHAINQLGQDIGRGMNVLSNQMSDINEALVFLNRNMDVQIEQQKLSNLLLQNISELLRVPDSEKERQHSIELGIKFFVNASKDVDLYADALEELLKAESLMKQDYFVLHRIGCIYLYVEKYINPEKALEYFLRAAKYASVESDSDAARLANVLTNNFNTVNTELNNSEKQIGLLAADSYEKAAFAAYILGQFSDAVNYQLKAFKLNNIPQNRFLLAKYQVRNGEISEGVKNLNDCVDTEPIYAVASFKEIDLINEPEVLNLISNKNKEIDNKISKVINKCQEFESTEANSIIKELDELKQKSYEIKVSQYYLFGKEVNEINKKIVSTESGINSFISEIRETTFCTLDANVIQLNIEELLKAKELPLEKMEEIFKRIENQFDADKLEIGSKYCGGIVFYIDKTGKHGLVCAEIDFGKAVWGGNGEIGASEYGISQGAGMRNTKKIIENASWFVKIGFFSSSPTAASLCFESKHNGFSDWYLPTVTELSLMYNTLKKKNLGNWSRGYYWTSNDDGEFKARQFSFYDGGYSSHHRTITHNVRAIRAF